MIKHRDTNKIICPWCGHDCTESSWYFVEMAGHDICTECKKDFECNKKTTVTYTTTKSIYDTCSRCKTENIRIASSGLKNNKYCSVCTSDIIAELMEGK